MESSVLCSTSNFRAMHMHAGCRLHRHCICFPNSSALLDFQDNDRWVDPPKEEEGDVPEKEAVVTA